MSSTGIPIPASPYRKISELPPATTLTGTELIPADQNGTVKITVSALSGLINSASALVLGAVPAALPNARQTISGAGITFTDTGAGGTLTIAINNTIVAAGPIGSGNTVPVITYSAKGLLTAVTTATITPSSIGAVSSTTQVATGTGLSGGGDLSQNRTLFISPVIAAGGPTGSSSVVPVITYNSQGQLIAVSTATITASAIGALRSASNLADVANVTTSRQNLGLDYGPDLQAGVSGQIRPYIAVVVKTATWTSVEADRGTLFHSNSSASYTAVIPGSTVSSGWYAYFRNEGAGLLTVTSVAGVNIDGVASIALGTGDSMEAAFDGSNYFSIARPLVPRGYLGGLTLSNDGGTPNSVLDVSAGMCADSNNATMIRLGAFTKSTGGVWTAGTGNNGMGTGLAITANTNYHVFAAIIGITPDVFFDITAVPGRAPANTVAWRRIGSFRTQPASTNIATFVQFGDEVIYGAIFTDVNAATPTTANRTLYPLSVPSGTGIKVNALFNAIMANSALTTQGVFTSPDEQDVAPATFGNINEQSVGVGGAYGAFNRRTDTSGQIGFRAVTSVNTTFSVFTYGYIDTRGRFA